jgi:hypothetical protein
VRRADVKHDEERGLQVGRQGGDNSSKGLDASPRSSNDHNVSWGSCQASRTAFSIARLGSDHPVPALSKLIFSGRTPSFVSLLALLDCTGPAHEPSLCARLRRGQVPGDLRHHLAKFIRLLTRIAQNRCPHLVRQKIVERCPGAEAFGAPKFMGTGEPRSVKFDIGFGTILDHLIPSWQIAEVRPTEMTQVGRPEACGRSPLASLPLKPCPESKPWSPFCNSGQLDMVSITYFTSLVRKIGK